MYYFTFKSQDGSINYNEENCTLSRVNELLSKYDGIKGRFDIEPIIVAK